MACAAFNTAASQAVFTQEALLTFNFVRGTRDCRVRMPAFCLDRDLGRVVHETLQRLQSPSDALAVDADLLTD